MNLSCDHYNHEQPTNGVLLLEENMRDTRTPKVRSSLAFGNGTMLTSHYFGETQSSSTNKSIDCLSCDVPDDKVVDPSHERHMILPSYKTFWETNQFFALTVSTPSTATTRSRTPQSSLSPSSTPTLMPLTTEPTKKEENHMNLPTRKSYSETSNKHVVCSEDHQQHRKRDNQPAFTHALLSDVATQLIEYVNERVNLFQCLDIDGWSVDDDDVFAEESISKLPSYKTGNRLCHRDLAADVATGADGQRDGGISALSSGMGESKSKSNDEDNIQDMPTTEGGEESNFVGGDESSPQSFGQTKLIKPCDRQTAGQQGDVIAIFEAALRAMGEKTNATKSSSFAASCGATSLSGGRRRKLQLYPRPRLFVDIMSSY